MDSRLVTFLKDKTVRSGDPFTHTTMGKFARRIFIDDKDLSNFFNIYCKVIREGGKASVLEKPEDTVPLIVDVDLRSETNRNRLYSYDIIKKVVKMYHEIIDDIVVNPDEKTYYCCILEKDKVSYAGGTTKDGFHLHFPFFITEHWVQKEYIRDIIVERTIGLFKEFGVSSSTSNIFDKSIPSNTWLMYGSDKGDYNAQQWKLKKVYNKDLDTVSLKSAFKSIKDTQGNKLGNVEDLLPIHLSIRGNREITPLHEKVKKKVEKRKLNIKHSKSYDQIVEELIESQDYLAMTNPERANNYPDWFEMGCVLFNIGEGDKRAFEMWHEWSKSSKHYIEGNSEEYMQKIWDKMEIRSFSLGTLKHYAMKDSPHEYDCLLNEKINGELEQGISMAHNDIAKILHIMYSDRFVCADVEKDLWYEFRGHRWIKCQRAITLRRLISKELVGKYARLGNHMMSQISNPECNDEQRDKLIAKNLLTAKLMDKLKNNTFKNSVMKEAVEYFYNEEFIEKMDEDEHLLVFENGVYDSRKKQFRDGKPEDYCTKSTGLFYRSYSHDHPRVKELLSVIRKCFPNKNLFKFFEQTVSDLVQGGNRHKIFCIWNGDGDNGKSIIAEMLDKSFGDYYYTPPTTLLTGKQQQSSGPTPELIPCKGARVVQISETDNVDILNCGTMKKLTGGDAFPARGLIKEPIKIIPHFKLILHCNKLPHVSADDKASWNRIRVLQFESTFVNKVDAPVDEAEQWKKKIFPKDKTLKDRIPEFVDVFMWWLIERFEFYGDDDLYMPEEVTNYTNNYHMNNDFYMQFIDECLVKTDDPDDMINKKLVKGLFTDWYKDSYPGKSIPNTPQLIESLEKRIGKMNKGIWRGWGLFSGEESEA